MRNCNTAGWELAGLKRPSKQSTPVRAAHDGRRDTRGFWRPSDKALVPAGPVEEQPKHGLEPPRVRRLASAVAEVQKQAAAVQSAVAWSAGPSGSVHVWERCALRHLGSLRHSNLQRCPPACIHRITNQSRPVFEQSPDDKADLNRNRSVSVSCYANAKYGCKSALAATTCRALSRGPVPQNSGNSRQRLTGLHDNAAHEQSRSHRHALTPLSRRMYVHQRHARTTQGHASAYSMEEEGLHDCKHRHGR